MFYDRTSSSMSMEIDTELGPVMVLPSNKIYSLAEN